MSSILSQRFSSQRLRPISALLPKLVTPLLKSHPGKMTSLLCDWSKIVGPLWGRLCIPQHITYKKGSVAGGVLHLALHPGGALQFQHTQQQLKETINTYFGYAVIEKFKTTQVFFELPASGIQENPPLTREQKEAVEKVLCDLSNAEVRSALHALGKTLMQNDHPPKHTQWSPRTVQGNSQETLKNPKIP